VQVHNIAITKFHYIIMKQSNFYAWSNEFIEAVNISLRYIVIVMVDTIQEVFNPLFVLSFIVGLRFYPIKQSKLKNRWIGYLYVLYFSTIWFAYSYIFYYALIYSPALISVIIVLYPTVIGVFITSTSVILSIYHRKV